jgi:P pilus assembly chaperone PapD
VKQLAGMRSRTGRPNTPGGSVRWLRTLSAAVLLASMARTDAAAQLSVNRTELVFRAGTNQPRAEVIEIRNASPNPVQAVIKLEDWDRAEDGTNRWVEYGTLPGSCGASLTVFPLALSLDPGAVQSIRVSMDSNHALPRECWAATIVESVVPRVEGGRSVNYHLRLATKIYLQPEGLVANGELLAMDVAPHRPDTTVAAATRLDVVFANTGGRHLETKGELQIRRPDNSLAGTLAIPTLYTLPGARSRASVVLPSLPRGRYVLLAVFDYGGEELAAGQIEYEVTG